jgi:sialate O-acetylesterase
MTVIPFPPFWKSLTILHSGDEIQLTNRAMKTTLVFLAVLTSLITPMMAAIELPSVFSDGMVVQHDRALQIWGKASPESTVTVRLEDAEIRSMADRNGHWEATLPAPGVGGPYEITIESGDSFRRIKDILGGEVWLCSGQSNMEWPVVKTDNAETYLAGSDDPQLRLFQIERRMRHQPSEDIPGSWKPSGPDHAGGFSAIGWHFGRRLRATLQIPVGIVQAAWGGTYIEAWTPRGALEDFGFMEYPLREYTEKRAGAVKIGELLDSVNLPEKYSEVKMLSDPGNRGLVMGWAFPDFDDSGWEQVNLPADIETYKGPVDGAFWFRREFLLPEGWEGHDLVLSLGKIDDFDTTYVNGRRVGMTGVEVEAAYSKDRLYTVPGEVLKTGSEPNLIAVRVFDRYREGGFKGSETDLFLDPGNEAPGERLSLAGEWRFATELEVVDPEKGPMHNHIRSNPNQPGVLWNGMIEPVAGYPMRGVLWYQGESNNGRPEEYAELFPRMIREWRDAWEIGDFPFYYVELANFKKPQEEPSEGGWAFIREAQEAALALPHVEKAVILDVGEADDIHPGDKATPARRLALHAEALLYGREQPHRSPQFHNFEVEADRAHLTFENVYEGLETPDGAPMRGFAIREAEGEWKWATVEQFGAGHLVLTHPEIGDPAAVRYAWASNPIGNVVNSAGLPLGGFRTDDGQSAGGSRASE